MSVKHATNIVDLNKISTRRHSSYRYGGDDVRDPMMIFACSVIHQRKLSALDVHRMTLKYSVNGVSVNTINNWMTRKTKKPQSFTLNVVLGALGLVTAVLDKTTGERMF